MEAMGASHSTELTNQSQTDIQVRTILKEIHKELSETIRQHDEGIDTEVAQFIKNLVEDRDNTLLKFFAEQSERYGRVLALVFKRAVKDSRLDQSVAYYLVDVKGLNLVLWVILKPDNDSFEQVSRFYSIYADLMEDKTFRKLKVDFSVFVEGEVSVPPHIGKLLPS